MEGKLIYKAPAIYVGKLSSDSMFCDTASGWIDPYEQEEFEW